METLQTAEKVKEAEVKPESPLGRFKAALANLKEANKKPLASSIDTQGLATEAKDLINKAQRASHK